MTKAVREKILIASAQAAKTNIFGKTPQLTELVQQLDAQLAGGEEEQALHLP